MKTRNLFALIVLLIVALTACAAKGEALMTEETSEQDTHADMGNMAGMETEEKTDQFAPLVMGVYEGGEILFIHTEASDADVATMLTEMMAGPEVVLVPELALASDELLAKVYVFQNGLVGMGPFGYQPDIFDSIPGDENYRPLREVNLVNWLDGSSPRELGSVEEVLQAELAVEVSISQPGIVVNMPILAWPGGHR